MTKTLVATPDPDDLNEAALFSRGRPPRPCTCGFTTTRTRAGHQWVFRRDPRCPAHPM